MIFYWFIAAFRKVIWFFRIPRPEDLARADRNERCPVCGAKDGRMRCVLKKKAGPRSKDVVQETMILRQHRCNECGARRFLQPLVKGVSPSTVLPSVARDDLERKEDQQAFMQEEETASSA